MNLLAAFWPFAVDGGAVIGVIQGGQHAAQRIGQVEARGVTSPVQVAQEFTAQRVVIEVAGVAAVGGIGVLFQSEGVHPHGRAASCGDPAQDTRATGVVDIQVFVG